MKDLSDLYKLLTTRAQARKEANLKRQITNNSARKTQTIPNAAAMRRVHRDAFSIDSELEQV